MIQVIAPGSLIAQRFVVEQLAGSGGMGSVYRARDLHSGQPAALKVLHTARPERDEAERFSREAQLLATLQHPGIVRHIAHGTTGEEIPFLAMEWLDGIDLEQLLKQRSLSLAETLLLFRQIADALAVAHRCGIVHRDLKPSNFFLRDGQIDRVTLLDFGIARIQGRGPSLTRTGMVVGTPGYMAPEQVRAQSVLTPSADIFALGCVLFQCLTGAPPFAGDYLEAVLVKILLEPAPLLRSVRSELPEPLERLVQEMLDKDPARRVLDASALLTALDALHVSTQLPAVALEMTPAAMLSSVEQRLVSVLVAWAGPRPSNVETLDPAAQREQLQRLEALRQELEALGMPGEVLAEGTLVATLSSSRETAATDQAKRAARCALQLRQRCPEAIIALATGRGQLAGQLPIGEAISRALQLAHALLLPAHSEAGIAVVTDVVTAGLLEGRFITSPLSDGAVALIAEDSGDESRRLLGRPTPCVGREAELAILDAALASCVNDGTPRALLVVAPAGVGKSRLRHELLRRLALRGEPLQVLTGRGDLMGASTPFGLLRQALLQLCQVRPEDDAPARQAKLRQRLGQALPEAERERDVRFLGELCGVTFPDDPRGILRAARQQPRLMHEGIRRAFLSWLRAECQAQPVLLVLEDLHWGDAATVQLIDVVLRELPDSPLLVVALGRPEARELFPKLWPSQAQPVIVRPLSRRASEQLVRQVLSGKAPTELMRRIVEQAAGNALFLEELIRAVAEGKGDELPQTVLAMLQGRIARLEPEGRRTLRAASVFGESCWLGGVAALLGMPAAEAERWLQHLVQQELMVERPQSRIPNETEYHFRHMLMRDAAYSLLSDEDRALGHRLAARFLEPVGESAAVLAYHHQQAGDHALALRRFVQAAQGATQLSQFSEARSHYAGAATALESLRSDLEDRRPHVDVLLGQVQVGLYNDPHELLLQRMDEARAIMNSLSDQAERSDEDWRRLAHIDYYSGRVLYYTGRYDEAEPCYRRVPPVARRLGDRELLTVSAFALGRSLVVRGAFRQGLQLLAEISEDVFEFSDRFEGCRYLSHYAIALAGAGDYREAQRQIERGLAIVRQVNQPVAMGLYRLSVAGAQILAADWPAVVETATPLLELAQQSSEQLFSYHTLDELAWAESHLGQHEQALAHRAQARQLRQLVGGGLGRDWFEAGEAEILLNAGRPEEALQQAQSAVALAMQGDLPLCQAIAERLWGSALARLGGPLAEVEAHFQAALAVAGANQQVVNLALTELAWGQALGERGDALAAREHFRQGIDTLDTAGCSHAATQGRCLQDATLGRAPSRRATSISKVPETRKSPR